MKLSGLTKMVKRQLVCNVFHNDESDDFYIGTASAIYCATGFPRPLNRNQMGRYAGNQRGYHDRKGGLQRLRLCIQN